MLSPSKFRPFTLLALLILTLPGYGTPSLEDNAPASAASISTEKDPDEKLYKASYYRMIVEVPLENNYFIAITFRNYNIPFKDAGSIQKELLGLIKISEVDSGRVVRKLIFPLNEIWVGGCAIEPPDDKKESYCTFSIDGIPKGEYLISLEIDPEKMNLKEVKLTFSRSLWTK